MKVKEKNPPKKTNMKEIKSLNLLGMIQRGKKRKIKQIIK